MAHFLQERALFLPLIALQWGLAGGGGRERIEDTRAYPQNEELDGGGSVRSAAQVPAGRKMAHFPLCWASALWVSP